MHRYLKGSQLITTLLLTSLLTACQHPAPPQAPRPLSPEQQQCQARCVDLHRYCLHQQQKIYSQCRELAHQQAQLNYQAYTRDQLARGKKPSQFKKSLRSFYDAQHCEQQLDCAGEDRLCQHSCD